MSNTTDIKIAGTIAPSSSKDTYPTHYAKYGKGGFISVASLTQTGDVANPGLPDLPSERVEEGMAVYVRSNRTIYLKDSTAPGFAGVPAGWRPYLGSLTTDIPTDLNNVNIGLTIPGEGKFTKITADNITVGLGFESSSLEELGIQKVVMKPTRIYVDSEAPSVNNRLQNNGQNPNLPFKSIERALLEAARLSKTFDTIDRFDKIAIVLAPGTYLVDNRPGLLTSQVSLLDQTGTDDIPLHYSFLKPNTTRNNFINAHYLIKLNTSIIVNKAYDEHILNDSTLGLTSAQKLQWKQHLTLFVEALFKDLEAYSNVHSIVYARAYKLPNGDLSGQIKSNEVQLFNVTLEKAKSYALDAVLNVGIGGFLVEPKIGSGTANIDPTHEGYTAVSNYLTGLTNLVKNALLLNNPWDPISNSEAYRINTGLFATAASGANRVNTSIFNPSKIIIKEDQSIMTETDYSSYVSSADQLKVEKTAIIRNAFKTLTGNSNVDNTLINTFINAGSSTLGALSLTTKQVKCLRDMLLIFDALHKDILNVSNVHILDIAKIYIDPVGIRTNFLTASTIDSEEIERAEMRAAIAEIRNQALIAISNSQVDSFYSSLVDIILKTLEVESGSNFVNPHTVQENKGIKILAGGVVVPKGVSFVSSDLRKTEIRPLYIGEDDLNHITYAPIFKVTGGTYAYGMTFKDQPRVEWTHHKVVCVCFANDDWEFKKESLCSYYEKVGKAVFNNVNYYSITQPEVEIVGPADTIGDRTKIDTVYGSSPYIYNCSVRSEWGMNGLWLDGDRVKGFKSMLSAQFTVTAVQRDKRAYERWNDQLNRWEALGANQNYYDLPPALYSDYIPAISPIEQKPINNAIRYRRSRLIGGLIGTDWRNFGFLASNNAFGQLVTCFCVGVAEGFITESGGDMSVSNGNSNFGETSMAAYGNRIDASSSDTGFIWQSIVPPSTLSSADIVNFNTYTVSIDYSYDYYVANNQALDRVYVTQAITNAVIFPFTFKAGSKIYLAIGSRVVSATLANVNNVTFGSETVQGIQRHYFNVVGSSNEIFTYVDGVNTEQIFASSSLLITDRINTFKSTVGPNKVYIKRVVDRRKEENKTYRLKLSGVNKRIPGYGFIIKTSNGGKTKLWVTKSEEVDVLGSIVYYVTLLGFKLDGNAVDNITTPYNIEDLDFEPIVDNTGKIIAPVYNSVNSPTYKAVLELVNSVSSLSAIKQVLINASDTEINLSSYNPPNIEFLRPSTIRSSAHTFEYVGYLNYSQGLPNYQSVTVPIEPRLTKNRKNVNGGRCFYSGLDHEGLSWVGDVAVNLATGESFSLAVNEAALDITVPASFSNVSVERISTTNGNVVITDNGVKLDNNANITFGNSLFYVVTSPPVATTVPVGTLALNSSSTNSFPFAYKLINDGGVLKWIELGSETYNNINLSGNFTANSKGTNINLSPKKDDSDTPASGVVIINPERRLEVKPGALEIKPIGSQGTIDNVMIGGITPGAAVFSHLTTGNSSNSNNSLGDAYIGGKATVIGDLIVKGGFRLENSVGGFSTYQTYITDANEVMDSFDITLFRSARYQIQVSQAGHHQTFDMLVTHDNTKAYYIEYGNISTDLKLVSPLVVIDSLLLKVKLKRLNNFSSCNVAFSRTILKSTLISPTRLMSDELGSLGGSMALGGLPTGPGNEESGEVWLEQVPISSLKVLATIAEDVTPPIL